MTADSRKNIRFRLLVNGEVKGTAGLYFRGSDGVIVGWVQPTALLRFPVGCTHPTNESPVPVRGITSFGVLRPIMAETLKVVSTLSETSQNPSPAHLQKHPILTHVCMHWSRFIKTHANPSRRTLGSRYIRQSTATGGRRHSGRGAHIGLTPGESSGW